MSRRRNVRMCRGCGGRLPPTRLRLCEVCAAAGVGVRISPYEVADCDELLAVARARERLRLPPLEGFSVDEVSALAWTFRDVGYGSYGKLRGYVAMTGKLPPMT